MSSDSPLDGPPQAPLAGAEQTASATQVLYRKWRPQTFAEVVGQDAVTRTLRNSIASGRVAHAYLLTGPRGTGKTSLGRLIAKAVNCDGPAEGEPCNDCDSCRAFLEGRAMDFIEQDAASHNSVDDIRQLRENVVLNPMSGRYKVYLLDEVHMLSKGAENALLKTLEEPPPHIIFVLATTEPHKVESTIVSRCQRFDLRRIAAPAVAERLAFVCEKEGLSLDEASLHETARAGGGSLRDAINALEQIVTYYGPSPALEQVREALGFSVDARSAGLARTLLRRDAGDGLAAALRLVAAVRDDGVNMRRFSNEVVAYLRQLLLVKAGAADTLEETAETLAEMQALAGDAPRGDIVRALKTLGRLDFREDPQSALPLELALVELMADAAEEAPRPEPPAEAPAPAGESEPAARFPAPEPASEAPAQAAATGTPEAIAPAEGEAPAETPPPAGVPVGLLTRVREACRDGARQGDKQLDALLNASCEVKALEGDVLTVGFYHTFHLERMEAGGYASRLGELASQVLGRTVRVELVHSPRRQEPGKIKGGHLVQAARELGARPIEKGD